jgi:hypothetical protein
VSIVRSARLLFTKDLRVLGRSRGLVAILIGYPVIIAILLALALSGGDRRPSVAFVNLDQQGRTVLVGSDRLSVDDYASKIEQDVDLKRLDPPGAQQALADGKVSAILTIPDNFVSDLQSGIKSPVITLQTNPRNPIEAQAIERNMEAAVFRLNQALATASQHLCPATLGIELAKLKQPAEIYITHLKPIEVELTMLEIEELSTTTPPRLLENNQLFEF